MISYHTSPPFFGGGGGGGGGGGCEDFELKAQGGGVVEYNIK